MGITFRPETEKLFEQVMKQRGFASADDLVRAALSSMDRQDPLKALSYEELRTAFPDFHEKLAQGLADAEAGRLSDGEAFFAELEEKDAGSERKPPGRKTA